MVVDESASSIETNEALAVLGIAAAVAIGGAWLYRRSQKTDTALTMLDPAQLALLPEPEEEEIRLDQLTEEEIIRLALTEEDKEEIRLAKLSVRQRRRQAGGITIL